MIQEAYVSFETARLLKEKGFRCKTNCYYNAQYNQIRVVSDTFMMDWNDSEHMEGIMMSGAMAIPTQQMAIRWLREVHGIMIGIHPWYKETEELDNVLLDGWGYDIFNLKTNGFLYEISDESQLCETYELTVESAIRYCLENLV